LTEILMDYFTGEGRVVSTLRIVSLQSTKLTPRRQ
jgi:hypothetical protein